MPKINADLSNSGVRVYYFENYNLRVDDSKIPDELPLISVADLESIFAPIGFYKIEKPEIPVSGMLKGVKCIRVDRAYTWSLSLSQSKTHNASLAKQLSIYLDKTFLVAQRKRVEFNDRFGKNK